MKKIAALMMALTLVLVCLSSAWADDIKPFAIQGVRMSKDGGMDIIVYDPQEQQRQGRDFSIKIDSSPVATETVSSLDSAKVETTWLFVVDLSILGNYKRLEKAQNIVSSIISGSDTVMSPGDKAAIFTTGMTAKDIQLINDHAYLQSQLKDLKADAKSNHFFAQVAAASNYLETSKDAQDRKVLVLISSGENDNVDGMTYDELHTNLQKTKTTVYSFALLDGNRDQNKVESYNALARSSIGGQYYEIKYDETVDSKILELFRNEIRYRVLSLNLAAKGIKGKTVSVAMTDNTKVRDSIELSIDQQEILATVSVPPVTKPPVTKPPVTEPPVTEPPATEPPVTEPPVTEPPATEPPAETLWMGLTTVQIGIIAGAALLVILAIVLIVNKAKKKPQEKKPEGGLYEEPMEKTEVAPQASNVSTLMVKLEAVGLDTPKVYSSPMVDELVIGRVPSKARLIVPDAKVSGANSKLTYQNHVMFIEDLNSTNGTQLNGMKLTGKVVVHQQDTIRVGQTNLRISWEKAE